MAVPTIADKTTGTQDTNGTNVTADISGWTLSAGDLICVFVGIDGARSGTVSLTQTGFTEHVDTLGGDSRLTAAVYSKELVSGDTSWTEIEATWSGNEKAHIDVFRIASGDHGGVDTFAGAAYTNEVEGTTPSLPAITLGTNSLAIGFNVTKGSITVTVNPTGYTTEQTTAPATGGHTQGWTGSDGLSGSQSANSFTLSSANDGYAAILAIAEASGSGSTYSETVSEGAQAGETVTPELTATVTISEGARAGEALTVELTNIQSISEGAQASDTFTGVIATGELVSEGAEAGEAVSALLTLRPVASEGAQAGESFTATVTSAGVLQGIISEGAQAGSTFSVSTTYQVTWTEGASASDTFSLPSSAAYATGTLTIFSRTNGTTSINP